MIDPYKKVEGKEFHLKNGAIVHSLIDLYQSLADDEIPKDVFHYHIQRNDFIRWIRDVYQDENLVSSLDGVKSRSRYVAQLKKILRHGNLT